MDIVTEQKDTAATWVKVALGAVGTTTAAGLGVLGLMVFRSCHQSREKPARTPGEARIATQAEAARRKAEAATPRMRQEEVGSGYQYDGKGRYLPPDIEGRDLPRNQALLPQEPSIPDLKALLAGGFHRDLPQIPARQETPDADPNLARERREVRKEERQDLQGSMLGYTTSRAAAWALRRADRPGKGKGDGEPVTPEEADAREASRQSEPLPPMTERAMDEDRREDPGPAPAGSRTSDAAPDEVADMRIGGGVGPPERVSEGKFLDCALINRVESDIADSPVMAQVVRDFLSLDGRYVLVPAGTKVYGTSGKVQSLAQARLYIRFHKLVFPRRRNEAITQVAHFPARTFPAMDHLGSLGALDRVNRHIFLQFGAAVALGVVDGLGTPFRGPEGEARTLREVIAARSSQNLTNYASLFLQKYANVVPTVTIREGTKLKCYFTQDLLLTPYGLAWANH